MFSGELPDPPAGGPGGGRKTSKKRFPENVVPIGRGKHPVERALEKNGGSDGPIAKRLEADEELGQELGIRTGQAAIVSGPNGTQTLQDSPSLAEIEQAIAEVE